MHRLVFSVSAAFFPEPNWNPLIWNIWISSLTRYPGEFTKKRIVAYENAKTLQLVSVRFISKKNTLRNEEYLFCQLLYFSGKCNYFQSHTRFNISVKRFFAFLNLPTQQLIALAAILHSILQCKMDLEKHTSKINIRGSLKHWR